MPGLSFSFSVDRNTLEGEFPWEGGSFAANGKLPEKKGDVLEFRMKNGALSCTPGEGKVFWKYLPSHSGNFGEKITVTQKTRRLVASSGKIPFAIPKDSGSAEEKIASSLCPRCVHGKTAIYAMTLEYGNIYCARLDKTVAWKDPFEAVWICRDFEEKSATDFVFRVDPSLYTESFESFGPGISIIDIYSGPLPFGTCSCLIDAHGKDFSLLFGDVPVSVTNGVPDVRETRIKTSDAVYSNFSLAPKGDKWRLSWNKSRLESEVQEGGGSQDRSHEESTIQENESGKNTEKSKAIIFDLQELDGSIRVGNAFIMVNDGKAMTDSELAVEKTEKGWHVPVQEKDFAFMASNANGTVNGRMEDGRIVLEPDVKPDILSGEFTLSFNTQTEFFLNNKKARQNKDGDLYFVLAEGLLVLSGFGRERNYTFFPGRDYEKKSFARRIDLVASYPDGSSENIQNISVQKSVLPAVLLEE